MDVYPEISNHNNNYSSQGSKPNLGNLAIESKRPRSLLVLTITLAAVSAATVGLFVYEFYQAHQLRDKLSLALGLTETSDIDYSEDAINARNNRRLYDLFDLVSAATRYQSNNNGTPPFSADGDKINGAFVNRYVDEECEVLGDSGYLLFEEGCTEKFMDPLGENYRLNYAGNLSGGEVRLNLDNFDYEIQVVTGAQCDASSAKKVRVAGGVGLYAFVYVGEGGSVLCADNS